VISPPLVYSGLPKWIASLDDEQQDRWGQIVSFNYGRRGANDFSAIWRQKGNGKFIQHYLNPNQRKDVIPREYGEEILNSLPTGSAFLSGSLQDWYAMALIRYLKVVENRRPDIEHIYWDFPDSRYTVQEMTQILAKSMKEKPVYVSVPFYQAHGSFLERSYKFTPQGVVYQVEIK
jgi:hypothetical protein